MIKTEHLEDAKSKGGLSLDLINDIKTYCIKIAPYMQYYKKRIEYYNQTANDIMTNEIALIRMKDRKEELLPHLLQVS